MLCTNLVRDMHHTQSLSSLYSYFSFLFCYAATSSQSLLLQLDTGHGFLAGSGGSLISAINDLASLHMHR